MTTAPVLPTMLLTEVEVAAADRLSPSFVRFELAAAELADFGVDGPLYDQRIKIVFPDREGRLPDVAAADENWLRSWFELPEDTRGAMRTYTVRAVRGTGTDTRLVVDFVLHPGGSGPGGDWAAAAGPGDRLVVLAPRRGVPFGGIEFAPPSGARLLIVGDETAVPAVASILEDLPAEARGAVFLEVPGGRDVLTVEHPQGVAVHWLPREGAPRGEALHAAVLEHLGEEPARLDVAEEEIDPDLWETPSYSSSGERTESPVRQVRQVGHDLADLYAWIAGESKVVTGLRRALVRDLGVDRHQVAFMGYWREGVAMRS